MMTSQISAFIKSMVGQGFLIEQSFSFGDGSFTQFYQTPQALTIPALTTQTISLLNVTDAKYFFLQTDLPLDLTITTPIGIVPTPTPATFRVNQGILVSADISSLTVFNPNNGPPFANFSITALGV